MDTDLLDICGVMRESRVKVKLLVIINDCTVLLIPSLIGSGDDRVMVSDVCNGYEVTRVE